MGAVVGVEAVVSGAVLEAEGMELKALPEQQGDLIETAMVVHLAGRWAASAAGEDSAAGSVFAKERFVQMKEAESHSAVGWEAGVVLPKARSDRVVVHWAVRWAASAAAEESAADSVFAKERFVRLKEVVSRPAVVR